jgi:hypothetical protein
VNFDLQNGIAVLERTPKVVRSLLTDLGEEWTGPDEGPNTWSPFDVLAHLIDNEETNWMVRARIILAQGANRRFEPLERVGHPGSGEEKDLEELLDRFAELRARNLSDLKSLRLGDAQLKLTGVHPEFGSVTLAQLLSTWVVHDLGHIGQIVRVMSKQYRDAVGPWRAYLPVLTR